MVKKPPSRVRYERKHPMVSARLDMERYKRLRMMVKSEKKSLAGFLKDFVDKKMHDWAGAYDKGYREGMNDHKIWYYCNVCGEKMVMWPNDEDHQAMMKYMKEHGWGHTECHEKEE